MKRLEIVQVELCSNGDPLLVNKHGDTDGGHERTLRGIGGGHKPEVGISRFAGVVTALREIR